MRRAVSSDTSNRAAKSAKTRPLEPIPFGLKLRRSSSAYKALHVYIAVARFARYAIPTPNWFCEIA